MAVPLEKFVKQLEDSGVIADDTLKNFLPPNGDPKSAEELALELVRRKKLTKFQAEEISKGKGKSLTLGNYVLMEKIGAGGMGQVFKARHKVMNRLVAVKVLPSAMTKDKAAIARFHREVQAAAKLRHINIVAADDADQANGVHFLVMELVEGQDLSALVKKNGPFSIQQSVNYILQAAKGLEFAHKKGIVHRDIKPANLLLDTDGTVKILDMGLARLNLDADDAPQADLTNTGTIMGTVDYMSPEQALDTKTADSRSDIYALGCSLFYLLTGKAVFEGDTLMKKLVAHREQPVPSLRAIRPEAPEQLEIVFKKMVAKKLEDRFQTMIEVIAALERCSSVQPTTETFQLPVSTTVENSSTFSSSHMTSIDATILSTPPAKLVADKTGNTKKLALYSTAVAGAAMLAVIIVSLRTKDGTLIVEVDQPGATVQVDDKEKVHVSQKDGKETVSISVDPGKHRLKVEKDGFQFFAKEFEMKSGGTTPITARLIRLEKVPVLAATSWHGWPSDAPKPAIAPFDAEQANKHQEKWAAYLKIPVEYTNSIGMKFRLIPPGEFKMGSTQAEIEATGNDAAKDGVPQWVKDHIPSEAPQHKVILTQPIYLGVHEVTQAEYEKVMNRNPSYFLKTPSNTQFPELVQKVEGLNPFGHAVEGVGWNDAAEFCVRLSEQEKLKSFYSRVGETVTELKGTGYRLPTEAEWEFACGSGTTTRFWVGDKDEDLARAGWFAGNSGGRTHTVGELKANPFGLFDVHGNVYEWMQDWWGPTYYGGFTEQPAIDPTGPSSDGIRRVVRGGYWGSRASHCRVSSRHADYPIGRYYAIGFRVSLTADAVKQGGPRMVATPYDPAFQQWVKDVQAMPAEQQIEAVRQKLMKLNSGFDGKLEHGIAGGEVVSLKFHTDHVTDVSPVRALETLKHLDCAGSSLSGTNQNPLGTGKLSNLSPLKGMRLSRLECGKNPAIADLSPIAEMPLTVVFVEYTQVQDLTPLHGMKLTHAAFGYTRVTDISPLKGMPLTYLMFNHTHVADLTSLSGMPFKTVWLIDTPVSDLSPLKSTWLEELAFSSTQVSDLTPLRDMPLKLVVLDFKPERDAELLRSIKTLETINGKPKAEFWKEFEGR